MNPNSDVIRDYKRAYREKNREKAAAYKKKYYAEKREEIAAKSRLYQSKNKDAISAKKKAHYAKNRERILSAQRTYAIKKRKERSEYNRSYQYGVSPEDYLRMLIEQGGVCAICGLLGGKKGLGVDHDHATGAVRSLLCSRCNSAIGLLQDSSAVVDLASEYLKRHGK